MKHTIRHTIVLLLLLTSAAGAGSIYKWVDDQGVVHYSDVGFAPAAFAQALKGS